MLFMRVFFLFLILSIFLVGCVSTEDVSIGILVFDELANPIEDARITFVPANDNFSSNLFTTDEAGSISANIASGTYNITVSKEGYFSSVLEEFEITGDVSSLDFTLEGTG